MKEIVLGISGRIASGKSTIAQYVSSVMDWPCASFGDYVRAIARERGAPAHREALQELGHSLIEENCRFFCHTVIVRSAWKPGMSLVIEGIRHAKVVAMLRSLVAPARFLLLFVDVPEDIICSRLGETGILDKTDLARLEKHSTEIEVKTVLRGTADMIVDGSKGIEELGPRIATWLHEQQKL